MKFPVLAAALAAPLMFVTPAILAQDAGSMLVPPPEAKPQPAADPGRDLFTQAAQTVREAKAISFRVQTYGTGSFDAFTSKVDARVRMLRLPEGTSGGVNGWLVRITGTSTTRKATDDPFDVAWHERTIEWLEHAEKKLNERGVREARSNSVSLASGNNVRIEEVVAALPYDKILKANVFNFEASATYDGAECDQIEVVTQLGSRESKARWALGVNDHFPRRVERIVDSSMMKGTMIAEISNVVIERETPSFSAADLRIKRPEGFNEDRQIPQMPGPVNPASRPDYDGPRGPGGGMGEPKVPEGKEAPAEAKAPIPVAAPTYPTAPAFSFSTSDAQKVDNTSIQGKVTVLTFFGSWSPQSKDWLRKLHAVTTKYGTGLQAYALGVRERGPESAQAALERAGVTFLLAPKGDDAAAAFNVKVFPSVIVLGRSGEILCNDQPARGDESVGRVEAAIRDALAQNAQPAKEEKPDEEKKEEPAKGEAPKKPDPLKKADAPKDMPKGQPVKGQPAKGEPAKGEPAKGVPGKGEPAPKK